jgi:hypothetical protein
MSAPIFIGSSQYVECPDSPRIIRDKRIQMIRKYEGEMSVLVTVAQNAAYRGAVWISGWVVTHSELERARGSRGVLTITMDCTADETLPPDEADLSTVDLDPQIERHPIFHSLTYAEITIVRNVFDSMTKDGQDSNKNILDSHSANKDIMLLLLDKYKQGMETYKLAGWKYTWGSYWYTLPTLITGYYQELPTGGPLYDDLPTDSVSWLRAPDTVTFQSTQEAVKRLVRTWYGAPIVSDVSHWDNDIYPLPAS